MKHALALVTLLLLLGATAGAQTSADGKADKRAGVISGRLTDAAGQPLVNMMIHLARAADSQRDSRNVSTDEEGRFRVTDLRRGVYRIFPSVPGYVMPEEEASQQTVRTGDTVNLTLIKGGVITGSVMSHTNEPMTGGMVQVVRVSDKGGRTSPASRFVGFGEVDDRGVYRVFGLPPGTYVVAAMGRHPYANTIQDLFPDDMPTYYPSSTRDTAQPVAVQVGEEISGIDIRYRGERGHAISGKLVGLAVDSANVSSNLQLFGVRAQAAGVEEATYFGSSFARGEAGFAFYGVPDGDYLITAVANRADGKLSGSGSVRVKVRGADATGVALTITPYGSINGTLVVEPLRNADPQSKCEVKRRLTPDELLVRTRREKSAGEVDANMGSLSQSEPSDKGEFALTSLEPGQYHVDTMMLGEDYFVRSITLPGTAKNQPQVDAARGALTLRAGERLDNLTVTVAGGAAAVRGRVASATEGAPRPDRLLVHMVPAEKEAADDALRYYEAEVKGDDFEMTNLSPGRYYVIARPPAGDTTNGKPARPVAWSAAERAALLKQAAAANVVLELRPCQRVADYSLSYAPPAAKKAAGRAP